MAWKASSVSGVTTSTPVSMENPSGSVDVLACILVSCSSASAVMPKGFCETRASTQPAFIPSTPWGTTSKPTALTLPHRPADLSAPAIPGRSDPPMPAIPARSGLACSSVSALSWAVATDSLDSSIATISMSGYLASAFLSPSSR